jgi:hypothetical protein
MANYFPLILDTTGPEIKELPVGDNLNLANSGIVNIATVQAVGNISGNYFIGNGSQLTGISVAPVENTVTAATTDPVEIDRFSASLYRAADYYILCSSNNGFNSLRLSVIQDDVTANITTYASNQGAQGTFSSDLIAGNVVLTFTPDFANIEIKSIRTNIINNSGIYSDLLIGDLMLQTGSVDLQTSTGTEDLNVSQ